MNTHDHSSFPEADRHKSWLVASLAASLALHVGAAELLGPRAFQARSVSAAKPFSEKNIIRYRFVETREQPKPAEVSKKITDISDKDSQASSSRKGAVRDQQAPKGLKKKDVKQLERKASDKRPARPLMKPEDIRSFDFEKGMQSEKPSEVLQSIEKADMKFVRESPAGFKGDFVMNMPVVSFGEGTFSEFENDSFLAAQTEAGKYFKSVRERIQREWVNYMTFNYRTSNVLGSEAVVHFRISREGKIAQVEKKYVSGDFLFKDFCETAVLNAGPFAPIPESMDMLLKKDGLDISIFFGYDVGPSRRKKDEDQD